LSKAEFVPVSEHRFLNMGYQTSAGITSGRGLNDREPPSTVEVTVSFLPGGTLIDNEVDGVPTS